MLRSNPIPEQAVLPVAEVGERLGELITAPLKQGPIGQFVDARPGHVEITNRHTHG